MEEARAVQIRCRGAAKRCVASGVSHRIRDCARGAAASGEKIDSSEGGEYSLRVIRHASLAEGDTSMKVKTKVRAGDDPPILVGGGG
jgi:hypothetical protein